MKAVRFFVGPAIFTVFFCLIDSPGSAQTMSFLKIVTSPRSAGMGQCAINLVDEESATYNPGALGLFHLSKRAGFFLPVKSNYIPDLADGISPRQFGVSIGEAFDINAASPDNRDVFGAALAYSKLKMVLPAQFRSDEIGQIIGMQQHFQKSHNISFAMGFNYRIRLGLGVTYKATEEGDIIITNRRDIYSAKGPAYDYGFIVELPLRHMLTKNKNGTGQNLSIDLVPSIAYVNANNGGNLKVDGETSYYDLPHISRVGLSILGTADKNTEQLASLRISYEKETDLVTVYNDLSKVGMETGFREFLFLRVGKVDPKSSYSFTTVGAGLDLGVLLNQLYFRNHVSPDSSWYNRVIRDMSLRIDYSHYNESGESPYSNSEFINIGLSF
jgi:hypothetical protein